MFFQDGGGGGNVVSTSSSAAMNASDLFNPAGKRRQVRNRFFVVTDEANNKLTCLSRKVFPGAATVSMTTVGRVTLSITINNATLSMTKLIRTIQTCD